MKAVGKTIITRTESKSRKAWINVRSKYESFIFLSFCAVMQIKIYFMIFYHMCMYICIYIYINAYVNK